MRKIKAQIWFFCRVLSLRHSRTPGLSQTAAPSWLPAHLHINAVPPGNSFEKQARYLSFSASVEDFFLRSHRPSFHLNADLSYSGISDHYPFFENNILTLLSFHFKNTFVLSFPKLKSAFNIIPLSKLTGPPSCSFSEF